MSAYAELDACALRASILAGERTPSEAVNEAFAEVEARDGALHAFLGRERELALALAAALDAELAGERAAQRGGAATRPLFGVPVALKANMCWKGAVASCASRALEGWRAPYTATFVERLIAAGAVPIGTTNMDEFAMGSSSENSAFGPSRNPWDRTRTPGGSSSGSAVAVAAGMTPIALGSDTGGSVRLPAAFCGIVGFKPSYGRVSRYGLIAFGSSLDQVSPFARSVRDVAAVLQAISGHDERDATSLALPPLELRDADPGPQRLDGVRVGVPAEFFSEDLAPELEARVRAALAELERLGCELVELALPNVAHAISTYYVVATAEASSNLARYDGVRYGLRVDGDGSLSGMFAATREAGFGAEVKRRILLGTYVLSAGYQDAWYGHALRVRDALRADFAEAFTRCDVIAGPTAPSAAFPLGAKAADPLAMYLSDVLTVPMSLAGVPAVSVPCGFVDDGGSSLPVGLQLSAAHGEDARCLRVAAAFERATDHRRTPPAGLPPASPNDRAHGASSGVRA